MATAGFQAEGLAPDSNWRRHTQGKEPYRDAVDFRRRYREDIAHARNMGVNTFCFSVEWARVEPRPGAVDDAELAYYDDLVREIKASGMTPMITLTHFVHPGWVADQGAWARGNARTIEDWLTFTRMIVQRLHALGGTSRTRALTRPPPPYTPG